MSACPFCDYRGPSELLADYRDVFVIEPISPVTDGHVLVIPRLHVVSASERPEVTGRVFEAAALYVRNARIDQFNLITSRGPYATQTIRHFHVHIVPRRAGDGLALPWTPPVLPRSVREA